VPPPKPNNAKPPVQDTVTISPAAQAAQPVAPPPAKRVPIISQVRLLSRQGQSVTQIAAKLGLSNQAVQGYLGTPQQQPAATK
jgi:DNA-binding NarL/FixJ family response regulator